MKFSLKLLIKNITFKLENIKFIEILDKTSYTFF